MGHSHALEEALHRALWSGVLQQGPWAAGGTSKPLSSREQSHFICSSCLRKIAIERLFLNLTLKVNFQTYNTFYSGGNEACRCSC